MKVITTKWEQTFFLSVIVSIVAFAGFIQMQLFLNWDVGWLLHATMRAMAGGTYTQDFYNPNPPLIFLWYIVPILFAQLSGINITIVFPITIFLFSILSWCICYSFAKKIFSPEDAVRRYIFLIALACVFLVLPLHELGQRDHLFLISTMPYLLAIIVRLKGYSLSFFSAISIGIFAGLSIALKPQFFILPLLMELHYGWTQRTWKVWLRGETVGIAAVVFAQLVVIYFYFPDYLFNVIPNVQPYFYDSVGYPWVDLIFYPLTIFCTLLIPITLIICKNNLYKNMFRILCLSMLGFLFSFLMQRTNFYYHMIPVLALSVLLYALIFAHHVMQSRYNKKYQFLMAMITLLPFCFLIYRFRWGLWMTYFFDPVYFFSFFAVLFISLFILMPYKKNIFTMILSLIGIFLVAILCSYLAQRAYFNYALFITAVILTLSFALFASQSHKNIFIPIYFVIVGIGFFGFPALMLHYIYDQQKQYKNMVLTPLISMMHTQPTHSSIYVLSERGNFGSPLIHYVHAQLAQRFDSLWLVESLAKQMMLKGEYETRQFIRDNTDKTFVLNMVAEDFVRHRPDFVFVDVSSKNILLNAKRGYFDFLSIFLENKIFSHEWKHYRYLTTIQKESMMSGVYPFKVDIYQRKEKG